ncbi:MAG: NfeD family protein [Leptolyngbyaceae cyanobacterium]
MLSIYWLCFLAGGTFVTLAALGGLDGAEFDYEIDTDVEWGIPWSLRPSTTLPSAISHKQNPTQTSAQNPARNPVQFTRRLTRRAGFRFLLSLLMSLRFWGVGTCFFGLTGLVLSWLSPNLAGLVIFAIALFMGLILGTAIASTFLALYYRQVNSLVQSTDLVGLMGIVEIPFDAQTRGKVRVEVKGTVADFVARTDEQDHGFEVGDRVLIVGSDNNRLWVVSAQSLADQATNPAP